MSQNSSQIHCQPKDCQEWRQIAMERGKDALALQRAARLTAAVYMAGYMLEAYLKACCAAKKSHYPTSGSEGHNLELLWNIAELHYPPNTDVQIQEFYLRRWSTDLRYCLPEKIGFSTQQAADMLAGANILATFIANGIKRTRRRC
ncbi:MAG: HEPN domain-containing protein [Magnetococcales bacterium]|nr:HEPN domain-containing protein [Magnetococcales bacterium]MBF0113411.1 HEPN domain-containing protein [Magnetococcales bacterium]